MGAVVEFILISVTTEVTRNKKLFSYTTVAPIREINTFFNHFGNFLTPDTCYLQPAEKYEVKKVTWKTYYSLNVES